MKRPIYLDNHATTRVDPAVFEAMAPWFCEQYGNASSASHAWGWEARAAVDAAREHVAELLGGRADEVVFTSGATEANALALLGSAARLPAGARVVTGAAEHHAVLDTCLHLGARGVDVAVVDVDGHARVEAAQVAAALDDAPPTAERGLVSVMLANNEVGTINALAEIAEAARARGALVHCDAAQAVGRIDVDVESLGVDLLSLSAHKCHGPKGIGALWVRRGVALEPLAHGGGQERGLRPGTLDVPGIVGLGEAARLARRLLPDEGTRIEALRDRMQARLLDEIPGARVNGDERHRLPGNLSLCVPGLDAEQLMLAVPSLALSTGSACGSGGAGARKVSHVLTAMGLDDDAIRGTLRLGLARFTTAEEADRAVDLLAAAAARVGGGALA